MLPMNVRRILTDNVCRLDVLSRRSVVVVSRNTTGCSIDNNSTSRLFMTKVMAQPTPLYYNNKRNTTNHIQQQQQQQRQQQVQTFGSPTIGIGSIFHNSGGLVMQLCDNKQRWQQQQQQQPSSMTVRHMGGGPRNEEHKDRLRAIRKARKIYFQSLPERPPKPPVCTKHYNEVILWKTEPISKKIEHRVIHICSFIIYAWLNAYPNGASLRKLQRDIAFRMQRKHRLPGKLPYQAIMPIVGKLERENYLSIRMKSNGHVLIYRNKEKNITPIGQTDMHAMSKKEQEEGEDADIDDDDDDDDDADEERFAAIKLSPNEVADVDIDIDEDPTMLSRPIPEEEVPYEKMNYRPKFFKEQKPKVKKIKTKKIRNRSDPIMDDMELPPDTILTSRGPRSIIAVSTSPPVQQSENAASEQ